MSEQPGRLDVALIGMGTVGPVIASALRSAGHRIAGVVAHTDGERERAEMMLPGVAIMDETEVIAASGLVILAVPDGEIELLVKGLADMDAWKMGQIVCHLAGPFGTGILAPAQAMGAIPVAIHPVMTFTGMSLDIPRLSGAPFAVGAPAPFLPIAQALVVEMGGEPIVVNEDSRPAVHAALTLGTLGIVTAVVQSLAGLERAGIEDPALFASSLLAGTAEKALSEIERALPAPIANGDTQVIAEHVKALAGLPASDGDSDAGGDFADIYRARARQATDILHRRGRLNDRACDSIKAALMEGGF